MADTKRGFSIAGLVLAGLALLVGVVAAAFAGMEGTSGGGIAFIGMLAVLPLAALGLIAGVVGAVIGRQGRTLGLIAVGLAVLAPVLSVALIALLVPASAFKI